METLNLTGNRFVVHPKHYKLTKYNIARVFSDWWEWAEYSPEVCKMDYDNFTQDPAGQHSEVTWYPSEWKSQLIK